MNKSIRNMFLGTTLFMGAILSCFAQTDSTLVRNNSKKLLFKKILIPTTLIVGGTLISNTEFETRFQENIQKGIGKSFSNEVDDYLRYVPMTQIVLANVVGMKAKNHWFNQAKNLFIINLASFVTVRSLKSIIERARPNNQYIYNSFPSGHTTLAFSNATMLYYEYVDNNPVYGYSGYLFATGTGVIRVLNNRHWVGDVLVGAGIGILITHLVYHFEPLKNWNPFLKQKRLSFLPILNNETQQLKISWNF